VVRYTLKLSALMHPVLKYEYMFLTEPDRDKASPYYLNCAKLTPWLDDLTMMEMSKIPKAQRPPEYDQLKHGNLEANDFKGHLPTIRDLDVSRRICHRIPD
jgi:hypothetical protein